MPAPKTSSRDPRFVAMQNEAANLGENNDCGVKAIAAASGAPYAEVLAKCYALGRKKGRGTCVSIIQKVLRSYGLKMVTMRMEYFISLYPGVHSTLKSITTHHPARFRKVWPKGTFLMLSSGGRHILTIKDGANLDWSAGRAQQVVKMWEVMPMEASGVEDTDLHDWHFAKHMKRVEKF